MPQQQKEQQPKMKAELFLQRVSKIKCQENQTAPHIRIASQITNKLCLISTSRTLAWIKLGMTVCKFDCRIT
jgi:hypothetical protein